MRVAVLSHTFFPIVGGAEIGIHEIYRRFTGDDVTIVTPISATYNDAFSSKSWEELPYEVLRYKRHAPKAKNRTLHRLIAMSGWQEFKILRGLHREKRLDAINIHFVHPFGLVALWSKIFMRVPVTISMIGRTDVWNDMGVNERRYATLALKSATNYTEITEYCLAGSPLAKKAKPLPYGVDGNDYNPVNRSEALRAELGIAPEKTMLLTASRLSPVKRVDVLMDVAKVLETRAPGQFQLVVVGQGNQKPMLLERIESEGITNVTMAGYVEESDLPAYYASADVFVSHSTSETFGVMFAEAMASGLPIVAANTSSVPMVVTDGDNGFLVKPFDVEAFADRIIALRENPPLTAAIVERNITKANTVYDWATIAARMREILRAKA